MVRGRRPRGRKAGNGVSDSLTSRRSLHIAGSADLPLLLTVKDASRILTASESFIRKLLSLGILEYLDIGSGPRKAVRFTPAMLRKFIDDRRRISGLELDVRADAGGCKTVPEQAVSPLGLSPDQDSKGSLR